MARQLSWERIVAAYDNECAYCSVRLKRLTKDHVIPISRGGSSRLFNVVPACQQCNWKKGNSIDWKPNPPKYPEMIQRSLRKSLAAYRQAQVRRNVEPHQPYTYPCSCGCMWGPFGAVG